MEKTCLGFCSGGTKQRELSENMAGGDPHENTGPHINQSNGKL